MNAPSTFSSFMFPHLIERSLDHPQISMTDSVQNAIAITSGMMNGQTGTLVFQHCQDNSFILFHLSTCGFNTHVYIRNSSCASSNDLADNASSGGAKASMPLKRQRGTRARRATNQGLGLSRTRNSRACPLRYSDVLY